MQGNGEKTSMRSFASEQSRKLNGAPARVGHVGQRPDRSAGRCPCRVTRSIDKLSLLVVAQRGAPCAACLSSPQTQNARRVAARPRQLRHLLSLFRPQPGSQLLLLLLLLLKRLRGIRLVAYCRSNTREPCCVDCSSSSSTDCLTPAPA